MRGFWVTGVSLRTSRIWETARRQDISLYATLILATPVINPKLQGTLPFIASELLSPKGLAGNVRHMAHHDLESLFWLIWIMSVNLEGPFNKERLWEDPSTFPAPSAPSSATSATSVVERTSEPTQASFTPQLRYLVDKASNFAGVPVWATPGYHIHGQGEVFSWKQAIPESQFLPSVSPYWTKGKGGTEFISGMKELRGLFVWNVAYDVMLKRLVPCKPRQPVTHRQFLEILRKMRDALDEKDAPTLQDIKRGCIDYMKAVQSTSFEHGGPRVYDPTRRLHSKHRLAPDDVLTTKRVKSNPHSDKVRQGQSSELQVRQARNNRR